MRPLIYLLVLFLGGCITVATKRLTLAVPVARTSADTSVEAVLASPDFQAALSIVEEVVRRQGMKRFDSPTMTEEGCVRSYADGVLQCRVYTRRRHHLEILFSELHRYRLSQEMRDFRDEVRRELAARFGSDAVR